MNVPKRSRPGTPPGARRGNFATVSSDDAWLFEPGVVVAVAPRGPVLAPPEELGVDVVTGVTPKAEELKVVGVPIGWVVDVVVVDCEVGPVDVVVVEVGAETGSQWSIGPIAAIAPPSGRDRTRVAVLHDLTVRAGAVRPDERVGSRQCLGHERLREPAFADGRGRGLSRRREVADQRRKPFGLRDRKTVRRCVQVVDPDERIRAGHLVRKGVERSVASRVDGGVDRSGCRRDPVAVGVL